MRTKLFFTSLLTVVLFSCGGNIGPYKPAKVTADEFVLRLNEINPQYRAYYVEQTNTDRYGHIIFYDADKQDFIAINLKYINEQGFSPALAAYAYLDGDIPLQHFEEVLYDEGDPDVSFDEGYRGEDTNFLYDLENYLNIAPKDLFAIKAAAERSNRQVWAENMAFTYEIKLSEAKSIVEQISIWNSLPEHAKTDADAKSFIKSISGTNYDSLVNAYREEANGNPRPMNTLLQNAVDAGKFPTLDSAHNFINILKSEY